MTDENLALRIMDVVNKYRDEKSEPGDDGLICLCADKCSYRLAQAIAETIGE